MNEVELSAGTIDYEDTCGDGPAEPAKEIRLFTSG